VATSSPATAQCEDSTVNQQDQQAIDELFRYLYQVAQQGGSRDPEAEARIQQYVQEGPPGLLYHMAQTLVAQHHALQQARAQQAASRPPTGAPAGFAPPQGLGQSGSGYSPYGQPSGYQQPGSYQPASQAPGWQQAGNHGFLAGAGKLALGIGGGILGAEVLGDVFRGVGGIFDQDRGGYDRDYDDNRQGGGFFGPDDDRDRGPYDNGQYDNGQYDNGGPVDDGGQFDSGFDNGDGGW
jgi:hypothetical protein